MPATDAVRDAARRARPEGGSMAASAKGLPVRSRARARRRALVLSVTAGALALSLAAAPAAPARSSAGLLVDGPVGNLSVSQWTALWWQWAYAPPVHNPPFTGPISNPLFDPTGAVCAVGQAGPVWFLAGTSTGGSVTRSCTVPAGVKLLIPLINIEGDNIGVVPPFSPSELRAAVAAGIDTVDELHLSVDGRSVPSDVLFDHRVQSPVFAYGLPPQDNAVQGFEDGQGYIFPVVSDGYWVLLNPLPAGDHVIDFGGAFSSGFSLDITYDLTVSPSGRPDAASRSTRARVTAA
jgi:hypothetical protein